MITTNNKILYERMKLMRSHGLRRNNNSPWLSEMVSIGFNYRITDLQTSLALSQLQRINKFISRRKKISFSIKNT